jgi:hypothetical protein
LHEDAVPVTRFSIDKICSRLHAIDASVLFFVAPATWDRDDDTALRHNKAAAVRRSFGAYFALLSVLIAALAILLAPLRFMFKKVISSSTQK